MSDIGIGEYVRTRNGYIIKVDEKTVIFDMGYKEQYVDMETTIYGFTWEEEEIVKHSKQLIDLIEVGDVIKYFSNYLGRAIKTEVNYTCNRENDYKWGLGYIGTNIDDYIMIEDIKEILTKEQYQANCYKVGGEDEC